jgi:hypothetical protein
MNAQISEDTPVDELIATERSRAGTGLVSGRVRRGSQWERRPSSSGSAGSYGSMRERAESQVSLLRNSINTDYTPANAPAAPAAGDRSRAKSIKKALPGVAAAAATQGAAAAEAVTVKDPVKALREKGKLIQSEVGATGKIGFKHYVRYFSAMGVWIFVAMILSFAMSQVFAVYSSIWISQWTASNRDGCTNTETGLYVGVYAALSIGQGIFLYLQNYFVFAIVGVRSGRALHQALLKNIIRIPLAFFDVTPLGRIINRFDKDMNNVDEILPRSLTLFFRAVALTLTTITIISYGSVYFLIACVPLGIVYYLIQASFFFLPAFALFCLGFFAVRPASYNISLYLSCSPGVLLVQLSRAESPERHEPFSRVRSLRRDPYRSHHNPCLPPPAGVHSL